jgi:hypothetical protein
MCKARMLTLLLFICAVCLLAETASTSSDKSQKSSDLTTIQGCLQITMSQYNLTESDGTVHQLSGAAKKLGPQVGHEVELNGKPGWRTLDSTSVGGASSVIQQPVFEVKSVKELSAVCKPTAQ